MRKEREASNGSRKREERQNAVAVPVTLPSLENFLWISMMKIRTADAFFLCEQRRIVCRDPIFGIAQFLAAIDIP